MAYQVRVSLFDIEPEVWRRIIVPADIKLGKLSLVIQAAMGWTNSHLHQFKVGPVRYSDPRFELEIDHEDETKVRLQHIVPISPGSFIYEYDFGDSWNHVVVVEEEWPAEIDERELPCCVNGARACPPEDVGGSIGYGEFLEAFLDPGHEDHEQMVTWAGDEFDPEAFDVEEADQRVARAVRRKTS